MQLNQPGRRPNAHLGLTHRSEVIGGQSDPTQGTKYMKKKFKILDWFGEINCHHKLLSDSDKKLFKQIPKNWQNGFDYNQIIICKPT